MSLIQHYPVPAQVGYTSKTTTVREYDEEGRVVREVITTETTGSLPSHGRAAFTVDSVGDVVQLPVWRGRS